MNLMLTRYLNYHVIQKNNHFGLENMASGLSWKNEYCPGIDITITAGCSVRLITILIISVKFLLFSWFWQ